MTNTFFANNFNNNKKNKKFELVVPTFYYQPNQPQEPNDYSIWQNSIDKEIYIYVKKWYKVVNYQITKDEHDEEEKYKVSEEDIELLKALKKWTNKEDDEI